MARIRLVHFRAAEAAEHIELLRGAGHEVAYEEHVSPGFNNRIRETQPQLVVIDLSRLPSHGREVAVHLRNQKLTRELPLVFVGGAEEKVQPIRELLPDATFTTLRQLKSAIGAAMKKRKTALVVPPKMTDRYLLRSAAQKLGIKAHATVAVFDAPRAYAQVLGELPEGATILEDPAKPCDVTVWFVHDPEGLSAALPRLRKLAGKTKLWVAWKKKAADPTTRLSNDVVRVAGLGAELVDFKVCAIDATWSGLAFAAASKRVSS